MARQQTTTLPAEAKPLQRRIESWRRTRRSGAAMPEGLWTRATALARKHGTYPIARGLPVDYGALKKRVEAEAAREAKEAREAREVRCSEAASPAFVEIPSSRPVGSPETAGAVIELSRHDGARMVVRLPAEATLDVAGLARVFCGGGL